MNIKMPTTINRLSATKKQRGDTIIEVLMAVVVIGLSLGAAYGISNGAAQTGRLAQERSEASTLAESQLELLKSAYAQQDDLTAIRAKYQADGNAYCLVLDTIALSPPDGINKLDATDTACSSRFYNFQYEYDVAGKFFRATATWFGPSPGGTTDNFKERVELVYRP